MPTIKNILVPVDFSPDASSAVEYATFLANSFQATITLHHVYQVPPMLNPIVPGADNRVDLEAARVAAERELERLRAEVQPRSTGAVRALAEPGVAADAILDRARAGGFDVIVMGTHGRTGLSRMLMGSVAEAVVRRADRPVVIVHIPSVEK